MNNRIIPGNVYDGRTCICSIHACCREAQSNFPSASRDRNSFIHGRISRCILHRGKSQSSSYFRSRCRYTHIQFISLDLLYLLKRINLTLGVGPILGAFLATGLYLFMKVLDYEQVNGDQDKYELDHVVSNTHKRIPEIRNPAAVGSAVGYLHGSHIGHPPVTKENRPSSETTVAPQSTQSQVDDLRVGNGERKMTPEEIV
jgi:hypothetical protein